MFWTEEVAAKCSGPQIINDSKTPSGRVHVGALRGVLIHDAIFRTLKAKGIEARYLFGVDDYDPLDEIPAGKGAHFEQYLGQPLCNVPPPDGSPAPDMAEHYMGEFWEIFDELGVRGGALPDARHLPQRAASTRRSTRSSSTPTTVRRVYKEVSNSDRPPTWYPFQAVCEQCGRIGTTEVYAYDGTLGELPLPARHGEVGARLRPRGARLAVRWQAGSCRGSSSGWRNGSRFRSRSRARARITRPRAARAMSRRPACGRSFTEQPPLNVPYEFFLVGGAKMSSSRGVGASARDMADLLPPEVLRFLMIRTKPNSPVNFEVNEEGIVKLFNEFDRYAVRVNREQTAKPEEAAVYPPRGDEGRGRLLRREFPARLRARANAAPASGKPRSRSAWAGR